MQTTIRRIRNRLTGWINGRAGPSVLPEMGGCGGAGLTARCLHTWPENGGFKQSWERLHSTMPSASPFLSWPWQQGLATTLADRSLRLITAHQDNELVAGLPLELNAQGFLDSVGYAICDYLDPLVQDSDAWSAILTLLQNGWGRNVRGLTLHNVRAASPCRPLLEQLAPKFGFQCRERTAGVTMAVELPQQWETYLGRLDPHERKEIGRKIRRAETQTDMRFHVVEGEQFEARWLSTALDLIEAAHADKAAWLRTNLRPILERIGPELIGSGRMRLRMLLLDDCPAAGLIELPSERGPLIYNAGYDPHLRQWSPGVVLMASSIRDAIEHNGSVFDLLRGDEPYKRRLGAVAEPLYQVILQRS